MSDYQEELDRRQQRLDRRLTEWIFGLLAEGWPLRSMSIKELAAITGESEVRVEQMLRDNWDRVREKLFSYGAVYQSRDEIAERAIRFLEEHDWCHQEAVERAVGSFDGVYSTLEMMADEGVLEARDTRNGTLWRLPC